MYAINKLSTSSDQHHVSYIIFILYKLLFLYIAFKVAFSVTALI